MTQGASQYQNRRLPWLKRLLVGFALLLLGMLLERLLVGSALQLSWLVTVAAFTLLAAVLVYARERNSAATGAVREQLSIQQEQTALMLHAIADAVITTDAQAQVDYMNATAEILTGRTLSDVRGRPLTDIFILTDERTGGLVVSPVDECLREGHAVRIAESVILRREQDERLLIDVNASPIRDRQGRVSGAVLVFHDVSRERAMEERLAYQARHDPLTGLLNRSEFEQQLGEALRTAHAFGRKHALCYMDLDQFKLVNDVCGHAAGDELLVQLSALLKATVRDYDYLARLGGDEFALLLMDCPLEQALNKAKLLRDVVRAFRFISHGKTFEVSFGVGVVPITSASGSNTNVLREADAACYAAKSKGRNQIFVYHSEDPELQRHRGEMRWASRISEALQEQRFRLYYQPIQALQAEEPGMFHCELLMRNEDEHGKLTSPEAFIPAAERFNLMTDIDRWVVSSTLPMVAKLAAQAQGRGERVLCGINLSGQSLSDGAFLSYVNGLFDKYETPPQAVCFELTESTAITNFEVARRFIQAMRERGCRFALDDFGTGVSSFTYLKELPLDYVKIDGSFVRGMLENPVDAVLVESINHIAHSMGIKTVAEFVEEQDTLSRLRELGVDYVQGYVIGRPAPLAKVLDE